MQPVTTQRVFSGRYELTHLVARGGMAQVYRARDRLLDRPVALKVLFPELSVDRAFVERFRREAQAAANLSHPNIVPVFDWGEDGGTYYIVMEYIDGQPLSQALKAGGPMPANLAAQIGARVADALAYAHRHGVVHRDVKPGNVLLTNDEQVKVTDFGIARAINTEESLTQTGAVMGTATYFSPEQAEGVGVDARSDIYSLGVVLYEMVAGRPPFLGDSPVAVASKHVRERPTPLSGLNPAVPPALEAIIAKAMAKSPDLRYQSAAELRTDLQRFADGRPVSTADPAATATLAALATSPGDAARTGVLAAAPSTEGVPDGDGKPKPEPEPETEDESKSHPWRWVLLALGLLVVAGLVVYFVLRSVGAIGTTKFTMPTLHGRSVVAATSSLHSKGLVISHVTHRTSTTVPVGVVISTDPRAGAKVQKGDSVVLVASGGGIPRVTVPSVVGQQYLHAYTVLHNRGLVPVEHTMASTTPTGTVLNQTPAAGKSVRKGSNVTLTVSTRNAVIVPNVVGETTAAAGSTLGATGLVAGTPTLACSSQFGTGVVMAQTPKAGTRVGLGATVKLTVSTGPCTVVVPNVVGNTVTRAVSVLAGKGLKAAPSTTPSCSAATDGRIIVQTPAAGSTVPSGSTVGLSVCNAPPPTTTTTTTTTTTPLSTTTTTTTSTRTTSTRSTRATRTATTTTTTTTTTPSTTPLSTTTTTTPPGHTRFGGPAESPRTTRG